ncbi:hypothetical protein G9A89_019978 [Geosiphon pyriformis]|nr:hypothetical protein G9A89_019978 [Geosiphon pyriformis]
MPFDLTYGRTAMLPISFTVEAYSVQLVNKDNFQETLQQRAYTLLSTLEGKRQIAAIHIKHSQKNTRSYFGIHLPELLKLALRENLMLTPISILPNATIQQRLQLCLNKESTEYPPIYRYFHIRKTLYKQKLELTTANLTKEAIQKQLHNEFKTTAGPTNSCYKLRAALRLYDLFYTCENVLQNPILQPLKIQYIEKLTELKFQQFSDQISSIILDYYLEITDSIWTSTELSLEEEVMLPDEIKDII